MTSQERIAQIKALQNYAAHFGSIHDDDCPMDDTCECSYKWINDGVNAGIRFLESADALLASREQELQQVREEIKRARFHQNVNGTSAVELAEMYQAAQHRAEQAEAQVETEKALAHKWLNDKLAAEAQVEALSARLRAGDELAERWRQESAKSGWPIDRSGVEEHKSAPNEET